MKKLLHSVFIALFTLFSKNISAQTTLAISPQSQCYSPNGNYAYAYGSTVSGASSYVWAISSPAGAFEQWF